jgi:hypothetical protein
MPAARRSAADYHTLDATAPTNFRRDPADKPPRPFIAGVLDAEDMARVHAAIAEAAAQSGIMPAYHTNPILEDGGR